MQKTELYKIFTTVILTIGFLMFSKALTNIGVGLVIIGLMIEVHKNKSDLFKSLKDMILDSKLYLFFVIGMLIWWMISALYGYNEIKSQHIVYNYLKWFGIVYIIAVIVKGAKILNEKYLVYTMHAVGVFIFFNLGYLVFIEGSKVPYAVGIGNPNATAAILIMILPFLIFTNYLSGIYKKVSVFLTIVALILTGSRGGMIAFVILLIYGVVIYSKGKNIINLKIDLKKIISIILLFVCFFAVDSKMKIISDFRGIGNICNQINSGEIRDERLLLWKSSVEIIKDYPISGIGLGNFNDVYNKEGYILKKARMPHLSSPHNIFLHLGVETGLIGAFLFISLVMYQLITSYICRNKEQFIMAGHLAVLGMCIHGLVDYAFMGRGYYQMYWYIATLMILEINRYRKYR